MGRDPGSKSLAPEILRPHDLAVWSRPHFARLRRSKAMSPWMCLDRMPTVAVEEPRVVSTA
jgi:hypothetical protein